MYISRNDVTQTTEKLKKNIFTPCEVRGGNKRSEATYLQISLKILCKVSIANKVKVKN